MKIIYKVHKWIGIIFGILILAWIVSGIVFLLPHPRFDTKPPSTLSQEELLSVKLTPADALLELDNIRNEYHHIKSITLRSVGRQIVYELNVKDGKTYLLNAVSGKLFTITPEIAERIAKDHLLKISSVSQVSLLKQREFFYGWPLPAYKVEFSDGTTTAYVSQLDGKVRILNDWDRLMKINHDIHNFQIIRVIINKPSLVKLLLTTASVISIIGIITGYYLSFPIRLRKKAYTIEGEQIERR